jgi:hypothetical protein
LQVGVAEKGCDPPTTTFADVGLMVTPVRTGTDGAETVMVVEPSLLVPLRVAFTKMPTVPAVVPAVKVSVVPLPLSVPSALLDMAQE